MAASNIPPANAPLAVWVAAVALAQDATNLAARPGCWVGTVDSAWKVAVNAHDTELPCQPTDCIEITLPPYHIGVWFHGWLAGLFKPSLRHGDDGWFAAGEGANEDTFRAACRAYLEGVAA